MKVLPLLVLLFSGSAFAAPDDRIEPEERTVFESQKPVTCTADPYSKVKQNFLESHGEVGLMRYLGDSGTGVEIIGNPDTGTITILEFIPSTKATCFISMGKKLEINSLIFEQKESGISTKFSY